MRPFSLLFLTLICFSNAEKQKIAVFQIESKLLSGEQAMILSDVISAEYGKIDSVEAVPWHEISSAVQLAGAKQKLATVSNNEELIDASNSKTFDALGKMDVKFMVTARLEQLAGQYYITLKLTDIEQMKQSALVSDHSETLDGLMKGIARLVQSSLSGGNTTPKIISATTPDSLIDTRDQQKYPITLVGNQTWMARNLAYHPPKGKSWCFKNEPEQCKKFGRFYDWNAAQRACPTGWHLPSESEWDQLIQYLGGQAKAGKKLKSSSWGGDNFTNFDALPAGYRYSYMGSFVNNGSNASFWSSSMSDLSNAWYFFLNTNTSSFERLNIDLDNGFSVRCIRDKQ